MAGLWPMTDAHHVICPLPLCVYYISLVGGIPTPLKNMSSSVGMMTFPIYGKIKNVPNHQPVSYVCVYNLHVYMLHIYIYVLLIYIAHIHCLSWHCTALRYSTRHCTALLCITEHYCTIPYYHCVALHYPT